MSMRYAGTLEPTSLAGSYRSHRGLGAAVGASAVLVVGMAALSLVPLGPLSLHMVAHIASMNVLAPLIAVAWSVSGRRLVFAGSARLLWLATSVQMVLLWGWHMPGAHRAMMAHPLLEMLAHATLLGGALAFWCCVVSMSVSRWQSILALLMTGKLACLLGSILIFAPRELYTTAGIDGHVMHHAHALSSLGDQHLAGLLMIIACPLSYVLAGVVLAAQAISVRQGGRDPLRAGSLAERR